MFDKEKKLTGKNVAILATDGFEESELFEPRKALEEAGAVVKIVSLKDDDIKGWSRGNWGKSVKVDLTIDEARASKFEALMLPGGVMNADKIRTNDEAVEFVRSFFIVGKPVAAICHAPWVLIEADVIYDRRLTSYKSLKTDLINAGAEWTDKEVVTDNGLVTSREPSDLPAFCKKMVEEFCEGHHTPMVSNDQAGMRDTSYESTHRH